MANLKFKGLITGSDAPRIIKLPIETEADIKAGTVVFLDEQNKLSLSAEQSKCVAGVVAHDYKCTKDEFNPENGSGYISVNVCANSVYELALPIFTCATDGEGFELTIAETEFAGIAEGATGCMLIAESKGESGNSEIKKGDKFTITGMNSAEESVVITLDKACKAGIGDKFTFIPVFGFDKLCAKDGGIVFGEGSDAKVISCDDALKNAHIVLCNTFLA